MPTSPRTSTPSTRYENKKCIAVLYHRRFFWFTRKRSCPPESVVWVRLTTFLASCSLAFLSCGFDALFARLPGPKEKMYVSYQSFRCTPYLIERSHATLCFRCPRLLVSTFRGCRSSNEGFDASQILLFFCRKLWCTHSTGAQPLCVTLSCSVTIASLARLPTCVRHTHPTLRPSTGPHSQQQASPGRKRLPELGQPGRAILGRRQVQRHAPHEAISRHGAALRRGEDRRRARLALRDPQVCVCVCVCVDVCARLLFRTQHVQAAMWHILRWNLAYIFHVCNDARNLRSGRVEGHVCIHIMSCDFGK